MHNKSFIVDNQIAIVGGRNIAAEYFQLETTGEFIDFDMLSAGPVVREVSAQFDTYWNHELAVPIDALHKSDPDELEPALARLRAAMDEAGNSIYADAISTPLMQQFFADALPPYIAEARLITDEPQKLLEDVSEEYQLVVAEMAEALRGAEQEIIIFTPYFIPRERGMNFVRELREKGIRVVLITNSLATNNHTAVHSHYSKYRKGLLEAGVELWEARADAAKITAPDGQTSLDRLTLHTKGILIDQKRIFVGSLNLDPRSIDINTEMGLLIDSPEMGARLMEGAPERMEKMAYRLKLDENGRITWHGMIDGEAVVETSEPQASVWRRMSAWFQKIVPEKQL
jgi:putative cardiolipin synthase